ncbi:MAG TPA: proline dehydrogenase [Bacteroidetes bacterium]|nr:proline dehydrogenase [Bacteroidota bacterium]
MNLFNRAVVTTLPMVPKPIVRRVSSRYIAGSTLGEAINTIRTLEQEGCCATLDILGEHITDKAAALEAVESYKQALQVIAAEGVDSNVSLKPTQLGLTFGEEFCYENIRAVVEEAKKQRNFIRIDMEDSGCTSATIRIYDRLRAQYDNVGLVIQAYLRRSLQDIRSLFEGGKVNARLCKGIYIESRDIAYQDMEIINANFTLLLEEFFKNGAYVGIATHDEKLVWHALRLIDKYQLKPDAYEFQMLLGVDEQLRRIIVNAGHKLRVYVPFGVHWYAYSLRRLQENPKIAGYIIKGMFS